MLSTSVDGNIEASNGTQAGPFKLYTAATDRRLTKGGDDNARSNCSLPICALFKAYTGERACKSIGKRLKGQWYMDRDDHDRKIRARKQRTDIGKYCFVNKINWTQLPAEPLATFSCM